MSNTVILCADEGKNLALAETIAEYINSQSKRVQIINLIQEELPLYTIQKEVAEGVPAKAHKLYEKVNNATGIIVVAPEYNGGIPPILTSAIAWLTRATQDWRACFNEKPVGLASHSYTGSVNLFVTLRIQLSYIGLNVLARPIVATPDKEAKQDDIVAVCDQVIGI